MRFDVSALAGQYSSISAISLTLTRNGSEHGSGTASLFAITPADGSWINTKASWNTQDGTTPWAGAAGLGTAGIDYESAALAALDWTAPANSSASDGQIMRFDFQRSVFDLTALINEWLDGANEGLLLNDPHIVDNSNLVFYAVYPWNPSYSPKLEITYTPIAAPEPSVLAFLAGGIVFCLARRKLSAALG